MSIQSIKDKLMSKKKVETPMYLSTGSTLLNLACSGNPHGGFQTGKYYFLVGDSSSGKTFLSLTCLAEAATDKRFKDYRFIYDNVEDGALMDIQRYFGSGVAQRMEGASAAGHSSASIEEFYFHLDDAIQNGKPFIYVLDSMDSLTSQSENTKFIELKDASRKGKDVAGSYGDGKAKKNSAGIRRALKHLSNSNSILIIINQTRDNIGFGFEKKTRSGGHALKFYATLEIWSSVKGRIKKTIKGKKRQLGIWCKCQIKKNRITGKESEVVMPIYHSHGIDDVGSCVEFLIEENHWKQTGTKIDAIEFGTKAAVPKLINYIESENLEPELRDLVGEVWSGIEEACSIKRKQRYD